VFDVDNSSKHGRGEGAVLCLDVLKTGFLLKMFDIKMNKPTE
jgi:hypothetical protein